MSDIKIPEIAYNLDAFRDANIDEYGNFRKGSVLDGADCWWRGEHYGRGKTYAISVQYGKVTPGKKVGKRWHSFYVTISQEAVEVPDNIDSAFSFNEVHSVVSKLEDALKPYAFKPAAYELWGDHPDVPYFIPAGKRSLCSTVVRIKREESE